MPGGETHRPDTAGLRDPGGEGKVHGKDLTGLPFVSGTQAELDNKSLMGFQNCLTRRIFR